MNGREAAIFAPSAAAIETAATRVGAGELVAFPTETVYGLGADATNDRAVAAIFAAKERPRFNPLIVHVADFAAARAIAQTNELAAALAARFWPGPLTLVLRRADRCPVSALASAGLDTLAVRAPDNAVAQSLLAAVKTPLVAPSANPSEAISPTTARHVAQGLGNRVAMILDGGRCVIGIESTVIDVSDSRPILLRPGGLPRAEIETLTGALTDIVEDAGGPRSPGRLARHYAPGIALRLGATEAGADEAVLAFGPHPIAGAAETRNLSPTGDLAEAAANLFAMLRELDQSRFAAIAAMAIPETGLGEAINDRLRRAASPSPD